MQPSGLRQQFEKLYSDGVNDDLADLDHVELFIAVASLNALS